MIHELKRSDKIEEAHERQLKYYILLLEQKGVEGVTSILKYPKLNATGTIALTEADSVYLKLGMVNIEAIVAEEPCPPLLKPKIYKNCSYYNFCYISE